MYHDNHEILYHDIRIIYHDYHAITIYIYIYIYILAHVPAPGGVFHMIALKALPHVG